MHVIFMPYGKKECVERLIRDMSAQKHQFKIHKQGEADKFEWLESQVRILPFGVMEYVFPKEDLDIVLATMLKNDNPDPYNIGKIKMTMLRKALHAEEIPEYKKDRKFLWITNDVSIIFIGIRKDREITEITGPYKDWSHEAI